MIPKRIITLFVLLVLVSAFLLNASHSSAAPAFQSGSNEILLGRPTDHSITVNVIPAQSGYLSFQYGTTSGSYDAPIAAVPCTVNVPVAVVIDGLLSNTRYYYQLLYGTSSTGPWTAGTEHSFHTQRDPGEEFTFTIISDSHLNMMGSNTRYDRATLNVAADNPDFHLDLGDTFIMNSVSTQTAANDVYLTQRPYFGNFSHSAPVFLAIGNHENEEGWNLDDDPNRGLMSINARKQYFLNPIPDPPFYTGNTDTTLVGIEGDGLREDYYAWEWGDALFVVLDPFQYTMNLPYEPGTAGEGNDDVMDGDQWSWTLGQQQFNWFKQTLENSNAKFKFVFAHHVTGGQLNVSGAAGSPGYVRGGGMAVPYFEWGGYNAVTSPTYPGDWGFDDERSGWGDEPIHQLMLDNGVSAFFHGHDHQFVHEERDGIVYQLVPSPSMTGYGFDLYDDSPYVQTTPPYGLGNLPNAGHLRVTVTEDLATVEYVRAAISGDTGVTNGEVSYSYTIEAAADENAPVVANIPNQTIAQGETFATINLDNYVSDADHGDSEITWAYSGNTELSVDITDRVATITPPDAEWAGSETITFTATDPDLLFDSDEATFTVLEEDEGLTYIGDIGTATSKTQESTLVINTTSTVTAGDAIIIAFATYGDPNYTISITDDASNTYELAATATCYEHGRTYIFAAYNVNTLPGGSNITITHTDVDGATVAVASVFRGLAAIDPLDQSLGNPVAGAEEAESGTTPTVGPTGTTVQANELLIGSIGTEGPVGDNAGTWDNSFNAGPRAGTTGGTATDNWTVSLGWRIVSATGQYTAQKSGITDRYWATAIATFKAASTAPPEEYTITATAGSHGSIAPSGDVVVIEGNDQTFNIIPNTNYRIANVLVDGTSVGAVSSYTFYNVQDDHTIAASFEEIPEGVITYLGDVGAATIKDDSVNDLVVELDSGIAAGDTIIITYATAPNPDLQVSVSDSAGNTYEQAALARNYGYGRTYIFYAYVVNPLGSDDTITISQSVQDDPVPEARAAVVSVFRGLAQDGLDQSLGNPAFEEEEEGAASTNPSVGPVTTTQNDELLIGAIGTEGPVEDAAGIWQNSFSAGQRVGTTGGDAASNWTMSMGYRIVSTTGDYTAAKSGITSRRWAAAIATFKAASAPAPGLLGDVDGSGTVNSTDALIILSCDVGMDTSGFCPMNCGDVNANGFVNSTDALIILSYDVGLTVPFLVGEPGCPSSLEEQPPGCNP